MTTTPVRAWSDATASAMLIVLLVAPGPAVLPLQAQEGRPAYTELAALGEVGTYTVREAPGGRFILYVTSGERGEAGEMRLFDRSRSTSSSIGSAESDPAWSPRGDRLAFSKLDDRTGLLHVWTMTLDAATKKPVGPARRVSLSPGRGPAYSSDGRFIAFTSIPPTDSAAARIIVIPAPGGEERRLVIKEGWAQQLFWSPDGRWIYYRYRPYRSSPAAGYNLERVRVEDGTVQIVQRVAAFLGFSSDGRHFAFQPVDGEPAGRVVEVATVDGLAVARFTVPEGMTVHGWSASGLDFLATDTRVTYGINLVRYADGAVSNFTASPAGLTGPAWSPGGDRLAYVSVFQDRRHLTIAGLNGSGRRQLVTRFEPDGSAPAWSPDGRFVAFLSGNASMLNIVDPESGAESVLAAGGTIRALAWKADGDGLRIIVREGESIELLESTLAGHVLDRRSMAIGHAIPLFIADTALVLADPNEVSLIPLKDGGRRVLYSIDPPETAEYSAVHPSPDGQWLAVPVSIAAADGTSREQVRLVPIAGGTTRSIPIPQMAHFGHFTWHPGGRALLVLGHPEYAARAEVLALPLNGDAMRVLTAADAGLSTGAYSVSPDGRTIAYTTILQTSSTLWEIDAGLLPGLRSPVRRVWSQKP